MNLTRTGPLLVLALTSGLLAGYLALGYLRQQTNAAAAAELPTVPVVVAAVDLQPGSTLTAADVRVVNWPQDMLPVGYSRSTAEVVGKGVVLPVSASEPLLQSKLIGEEAGGGLPITIPRGMRAVSIKVDEVIGVAGFVLPGTRVDVLVTLPTFGTDQGPAEPVTVQILQNIQAIAADQTMERDPEGTPEVVHVITLLVTPQEAERLTLAMNEGRIQLALRNTLDREFVSTAGAQIDHLMGRSTPPPAPQPRRTTSVPAPARAPVAEAFVPATHMVETYRGGERSVSTFSKRQP